MLLNAAYFVVVGMACWGIYRLSPGLRDADRMPAGRGIRTVEDPGAWPERRRFVLARLLHAPTRHLASVSERRGGFQARCACGWQGGWQHHQGDAFADAHAHTRYVDAALRSIDHDQLPN
jgi:hypothetical protein